MVLAAEKRTWVQPKSNSFYTFAVHGGQVTVDSTLVQGNQDADHRWIGRLILQFDMTGLPKNAIIHSATLSLFCEQTLVFEPQTEYLVYERISAPWKKEKISHDHLPQTSKIDAIRTG